VDNHMVVCILACLALCSANGTVLSTECIILSVLLNLLLPCHPQSTAMSYLFCQQCCWEVLWCADHMGKAAAASCTAADRLACVAGTLLHSM